MDRTKISDRNAVHLLAATAQSLGHNVEDLAINRTTIKDSRRKIRLQEASILKSNMKIDEEAAAIVHWDGKILPDTAGGKDFYDRLPIMISYGKDEKLLSVPKLGSDTGYSMANAVNEALTEYDLDEKVVAMAFDTTASNTGRHAGACKLLEDMLGRKLI